MTDRTPAIIACMRDMIAERCAKTSYNEENIDLFTSLDALTIAVDSALVFGLWPVTGDDECAAIDLLRAIDGQERPFESNRPIAGAVARRLSEVACALFVQGGDESESGWLLRASCRLIGIRMEDKQ